MHDKGRLTWKCRDREFSLGKRPLIMGILNVTPDSFSDGGRHAAPENAGRHALAMINDGADIIDVGGESTRPGASPVSVEEELARVIPVVKFLAGETPAVISVDTSKAVVAAEALEAGAHIVNDVSGLRRDADMAETVRRFQAGLVVMHMQGTPETMQQNPGYRDVVAEVMRFFREQIAAAVAAGIAAERIVVDPGIGFGKTLEHNLALLRGAGEMAQAAGRPVLIGASRKRFIGEITGKAVDDRLAGSLAAMSFAVMRGAHIIRVHDVKESCDTAHMLATLGSTEAD